MTPRIASLVPSVTELLVALGLGPRLVARTGYCIHPAEAVAAIAKVGGTKDVNLDKLRRLAPTHVVVNIDENRRDSVEALRAFIPEVIVTHPCGPLDVAGLIHQVASAFDTEPGVCSRAKALTEELANELDLTRPGQHASVPVLYLIWREPWMTVARDTYVSRLLAHVGWRTWPEVDGGDRGAARYPVIDGTEPWLAGIERVLLSSEPYAFTAQHLELARALCPQARVSLVDGELLSWYGPRTAVGLRYLRGLVG